MEDSLQALCRAVRALLPTAGAAQAGSPALTAFRCTGGTVSLPQGRDPYLFLVLNGTLRLHTVSGILDYGPGQYSISQIDTPLSGQVFALSPHRDLLALALALPAGEVIAATLELDDRLLERITGDALTQEEQALAERAVLPAMERLLSLGAQALPSAFLWRNITQEIIYHLLCGPSGRAFLQSIAGLEQVDEIYGANSWIKENFKDPFTVEQLARQWNMSVSLFHRKFKSAVGMGPLQCQKRLRLTEARRLMLDEGKNVTQAALEVGYESVSQFVRDYKKMFGAAAAEGAPLMAIQSNDPRLTLVAGGYPLFAAGKIAGGIGVGGGTEAQDCAIAEYVVSTFEEMVK